MTGAYKNAVALGQRFYWTGSTCRHGHICYRQTSDRCCVECKRLRRAENKNSFRGYRQKWRDKNRDVANAKGREWHANNREKSRLNGRLWRERNAERKIEAGKKWKRSNPDKVAAYSRNRRAAGKLAVGYHTAQDVLNLLRLQGGKCVYCRCKLGDKFHVDHIIALKCGGGNGRENLQILCVSCNLSKGVTHPIDFARSIGRLL